MDGNLKLAEKSSNSLSAGHQPKKKSTIDQQQSTPAHLQIKHLPQQQFIANNSTAIDRRHLSNTSAVVNTNTLPLANHHSVINSSLQQKSSSSSAVHSLRMASKSEAFSNNNSNVENLSPQKLLLGSGGASNGENGAVGNSKDSGDEDDPSSPFRRNSINNNGNNTSEFSNLSLAGDNENKLAKKSKGKNILKRLFCCFSSSTSSITQRNYKTSDQAQAGTQQGASSLSKQANGSSSNNQLNQAGPSNTGINSSYLTPQQLQPELRDSNNNESIIINIEKDEQSVLQSNNQNTTIKSDLVITSVERSINSPNSNNSNVTTSSSTMPARIINIAINNANMNSYYSNESFIPQNIPLGDIVDNFDLDYDYEEEEKFLLAPAHPSDQAKKCLVIDLDETLVHSSFKHVHNADFIVPVEIDGITHQVYVLKRPHVDEFLQRMGQLFECVLFTASLAKYADPVSDLLDKWGVFRARLFREACVYYRGNYVKDLSRLGRDLNKMVILDNSPASYIFHPDNAVPCTSWFDDIHDRELLDLIPFFERLAAADSVYSVLKQQPSNHFHHPHMYQPSPLPSSVSTHYNIDASSQSTPIASINPQVVPSSSLANSITSPTSTNSIIYQVPQTPQYEDNKVFMSIELNKQNNINNNQ